MPLRPLPLIDAQELARRNNEASIPVQKLRRRGKKSLGKLLSVPPKPSRPLQAVGFFYPERKGGHHDSRP